MSVIDLEQIDTANRASGVGHGQSGHQSNARPPVRGLTRRGLQITLGALWILDGLLQLQSFMFTRGFASRVIAPSAVGQPVWVSWPVLRAAHLIGAHPLAANGTFAAIQILLGGGLLVRRTVQPAIVASVLWASGVWFVGEGLGGLAGGSANLLAGAPGAALLYGVLAVAAWPTGRTDNGTDRVASWFPKAWAALWLGLGLFALLPANRSTASVVAQIHTSEDSAPGWLRQVDGVMVSMAHDGGGTIVVMLAVIPVAIGLLGLGTVRMRHVSAWAAVAVALATWAVGQSFGALASGTATDPNTGPVLVVAALALFGMTGATAGLRSRSTDPGHLVTVPISSQ